MKEQLMAYITTAIASVGGIAGIISILCTIIKVFGGNSVKAKLAAQKVELDKTMSGGLDQITDSITSRMNTDISIDVSAKLDTLLNDELEAQKEMNARITEDNNALRESLAMVMNALAEMKAMATEDRAALAQQAAQLADVKPVEREVKPVAHISLQEPKEVEETPQEQTRKVIL